MRIVPGPADRIVEKPDQINDVVVNVLGGGCAPMKHVEQLEFEAETVTLHDDVIGMQIAVIFPQLVYRLDASRQGVQEVHGQKGVEALARLACEEMAEQLAHNELGDQEGDGHAAIIDLVLRVVLDHDRALPQLVQLFRVKQRGLVALVAVWKEKLGGALAARGELAYEIDLTHPPHTQKKDDNIMAARRRARAGGGGGGARRRGPARARAGARRRT